MPGSRYLSNLCAAALLAASALAPAASAQEGPTLLEFAKPVKGPGGGGGGGGGGTGRTPTYYDWMHAEVPLAWTDSTSNRYSYLGQGTTITVVDDFTSLSRYRGNLGDGFQRLRHGEWTLKEAGMIAPSAAMASHDFYTTRTVNLAETGFNVVNLSYGMVDGLDSQGNFLTVTWDPQEASIIAAARNGTAVVSKAAGNDYGTAVGQPNSSDIVDYLGRDLIGTQGAIFVGALNRNGSDGMATRATYSNIAGDDPTVQAQFLTVGVESNLTNLAGTSFAAPVVAGYASVLSSKFPAATPAQVVDRLLDTAHGERITNYDLGDGRQNLREYGQGEASIGRAVAPGWIQ